MKKDNKFIDNTEELIEEELEFARTIELSEDGKAIIEVSLPSQQDFYSPYSVKGDDTLHPELDNYILEAERNIKLNKKLKINIYTDKDETTSHQQIKKAFRMHYASKLATAESQLRKDLFISLIFLVTGILFLGLYLVSIFHDWHLAVSSILDIVAWVFLWEFVDKFAIQNSFTRLQKKRYLRLVKAEVSIRTRAY